MKAVLLCLLMLSGLMGLPLYAVDGASQWETDFGESLSSLEALAPRAPRLAPFALSLARTLGEAEFVGMPPQDAAGLALRLAEAIDGDIRTGLSFQDAAARSRQEARILKRDYAGGGGGGLSAMSKIRSKAAWKYAKSRAGNLVNPLRKGSSSASHEGKGPQ